MPLPTLVKTYDYTKINQTHAASGTFLTDAQTVMLALANSLLTLGGSAAWTCVGSSNGTGTGALDAVNRWASIANLVWAIAGSNHGWIVLKQSAIGASGGIQICFDLVGSNAANVTFAISANAGFTGGTATARPTATDEAVFSVSWFSSSVSTVLHVWGSTDGTVVHAQVFSANVCQLNFHASNPANAISGWSHACVYWIQGSGNCNLASTLYQAAAARGVITAVCSFLLTGEAVNGILIEAQMTFADDDTAEWPFGPIGLYTSTASHRGRKGTLIDLWWGSQTATNADNYPADNTRQFVQFGHLIFPWNGSVPLIS